MALALTSFIMSLGLEAQSLALALASDYVSLTPTLVMQWACLPIDSKGYVVIGNILVVCAY